MSAARTDWKSLPLEEKPLKERKPKPPSDEGGGPKGRRERKTARFLPALRENDTGLSPPVSCAASPRVRGGQGVSFQKTASSEGGQGWVSKNLHRQRGPRVGAQKPAPSERRNQAFPLRGRWPGEAGSDEVEAWPPSTCAAGKTKPGSLPQSAALTAFIKV